MMNHQKLLEQIITEHIVKADSLKEGIEQASISINNSLAIALSFHKGGYDKKRENTNVKNDV